MPLLRSRKKTTRASRDHRTLRRGGDIQKLHINVSSPRIVMIQVMRGIGKGLKLAVCLAFVGLLAWGGVKGVRHVFIDNEKYKLQEIKLETNGHLDHARVVSEANIDLNSSLFAIDAEEVRASLIALPEVIDCQVQHRLPGTLKIQITERVPFVWIECPMLNLPGREDGGILADKDGITFPCEGNLWNTARDLPVIVIHDAQASNFNHGSPMEHSDASRALKLIHMFIDRKVRNEWQPERVILRNNYSMEAVCNDGTQAIFGMYDHDRQMENFLTISEHTRLTNRDLRHINLIPKKNIPVKFAGGPVMIQPMNELQPANRQER